MYNLAVAYFQGDGIQQNYQKAYAWYQKRRTWVMPVPNIIWAACIFMGKGCCKSKPRTRTLATGRQTRQRKSRP